MLIGSLNYNRFLSLLIHFLATLFYFYVNSFIRHQLNSWNRARILGRNWVKSLKSLPPCYFILFPLPLSNSGLKLVCNVNIVHRNLKSENSKVTPNSKNKYFRHFWCYYDNMMLANKKVNFTTNS
jgi:hypothetical protein